MTVFGELKVKKLSEPAKLPVKGSPQAAGWDLHSNEEGFLRPGERKLFGTGLAFALPEGYEMQIRPRSGMAWKKGVTVLNSPGTIDSDYRGEVKVMLVNHDKSPVQIRKGDRIAQAVIAQHAEASLILTDDLDDTERGEGGFGSTGS